jgi:hypothetical protein
MRGKIHRQRCRTRAEKGVHYIFFAVLFSNRNFIERVENGVFVSEPAGCRVGREFIRNFG